MGILSLTTELCSPVHQPVRTLRATLNRFIFDSFTFLFSNFADAPDLTIFTGTAIIRYLFRPDAIVRGVFAIAAIAGITGAHLAIIAVADIVALTTAGAFQFYLSFA